MRMWGSLDISVSPRCAVRREQVSRIVGRHVALRNPCQRIRYEKTAECGRRDGVRPRHATPSIFAVELGRNGTFKVARRIPLTTRDGKPITGLPNPLEAAKTEKGYNRDGKELPNTPLGGAASPGAMPRDCRCSSYPLKLPTASCRSRAASSDRSGCSSSLRRLP
jgi:hypothetical protein